MKRFAFKMFLKPGCEEEYAKRHAELWPELKRQITESGVRNYSIYWDKDTNILFGYQGSRRRCQLSGCRSSRRDHTQVVGLHGRHHGGKPRQLSCDHTYQGSIPS